MAPAIGSPVAPSTIVPSRSTSRAASFTWSCLASALLPWALLP
jgi:hypothetical protein